MLYVTVEETLYLKRILSVLKRHYQKTIKQNTSTKLLILKRHSTKLPQFNNDEFPTLRPIKYPVAFNFTHSGNILFKTGARKTKYLILMPVVPTYKTSRFSKCSLHSV